MELLYIWIDDYKNIRNQGFNFSPRWRFEYDGKRMIKITEKNTSVESNFFSKGKRVPIRYMNKDNEVERVGEGNTHHRLLNITAIVGENGSGKSSLLDFIKYELTLNESWNNNSHFIEKREWLSNLGKNIVIFNFGHQTFVAWSENGKRKVIEIQLMELEKPISINIKSYSPVPFDWKKNNRHTALPTTIIFYSNFFDGKKEFEKKGLINISTNYLLRKDKERYEMNMDGSRRKFKHEWVHPDNIETFNSKEIERQLEYLDHINYMTGYKKEKNQLSFLQKN